MEMLEFLKENTDKNMSLLDLVDVFERMCQINNDISGNMLLFETGTFAFGGTPKFYFSLVRQFPNDDEEFFQVHLDVIFNADILTEKASVTIWDIEVQGDFFEYVRNSEVCRALRNTEISDLDIYVDET